MSLNGKFWRSPLAIGSVLFGMLTGAGLCTLATSEAASYLSNDPRACVNCHIMRDQYDGWQKASHHVRSPLLDVSRSCQTCHRYPEQEILARVASIQDRTKALLLRTEDAVLDLIRAIEDAKKAGVAEERLNDIRAFHRKAEWRVDFVAAENSMGFHAPGETLRILGEAIDFARQGQVRALELLRTK